MRLFYLFGLQYLRPAAGLTLIFTVLFGAIYPMACAPVLQLLFHDKATGSKIVGKDGENLGSALIGRHFHDPKYFWGRPSATEGTPYNAMQSGGSNFAPGSLAFHKAIKQRISELQALDPNNDAPIPADLVTASGSGLDPHITMEAAQYQLPRVARERNMSVEEVADIVSEYTEKATFGFLGKNRVNVLKVNLALDGKI